MSEGRSDHRQQLRFLVGDGEDLLGLVDTAGARACVGVADVSLGGAGLVLDRAALVDGRRPLHLALLQNEGLIGESDVELVHVGRTRAEQRVVGVRFQQTEAFLRGLCHYLVECHSSHDGEVSLVDRLDQGSLRPVSDKRRPRRLLKACIEQGIALTVAGTGGRRAGVFHARVLSGSRVEGELGSDAPLTPGRPYYLFMPAYTSVHLLMAKLEALDAHTATFELGEQVFEGGLRRLCRVLTAGDDAPLLEFVHPQIPGKLVRKKALEIGVGGMRVPLDIEEDLLAAGSLVDAAVLRLPGGVSLPCHCAVRHTYRHDDGDYSCGIELLHLSANGRRRWVRHVLSRAHPQVEEASAETLGEVWDVFERSGYTEEKPTRYMARMKQPFVDTWEALIDAEGGSRCWLFRDQGEAVGTVSASRVYSKTWLLHHLAADLFHFERKAKNLAVVAELVPRMAGQWLAGLHSEDFALTYFDNNKAFNKWSWFDFFGAHEDSGLLVSQRVSVRDYILERLPPSPVSPTVWVREARDDELGWVAEELANRDPPLLHAAFDHTPDRLRLDGHDAEARSLRRHREILVAGHGSPAAVALCEIGATGTNIFSLYNTVRIFVTEERLDRDQRAALRDTMLARAWRFYAQRGAPSFLYVTGPGDEPPPDDLDCFEAKATRTVLSGKLFTHWAESVDATWSLS